MVLKFTFNISIAGFAEWSKWQNDIFNETMYTYSDMCMWILNLSTQFIHNKLPTGSVSYVPIGPDSAEYRLTDLPWLLTKPMSASSLWQLTHLKHLGCQHWLMALITLPTTNSPEGSATTTLHPISLPRVNKYLTEHLPQPLQQGAKRAWKSWAQYFLPSCCR